MTNTIQRTKVGILSLAIAITGSLSLGTLQAHAEDWKGQAPQEQWNFGFITGLGILDSNAAFALQGTAAHIILPEGWISDINDQVWGEIELGPYFLKSTTALVYSTHLRWDFVKDPAWTLFALGGFGGNVTDAKLGDRWAVYPRIGLGGFLYLAKPLITLRAEISHDLLGVGVTFAF